MKLPLPLSYIQLLISLCILMVKQEQTYSWLYPALWMSFLFGTIGNIAMWVDKERKS